MRPEVCIVQGSEAQLTAGLVPEQGDGATVHSSKSYDSMNPLGTVA